MNNESSLEPTNPDEQKELLGRRLFLQSVGKWSAAAIAAAVDGSTAMEDGEAAVAG
jgi:hypothetical protein